MTKLPHPPDRLADLLDQLQRHAERRDHRAIVETVAEARAIASNRARIVRRAS